MDMRLRVMEAEEEIHRRKRMLSNIATINRRKSVSSRTSGGMLSSKHGARHFNFAQEPTLKRSDEDSSPRRSPLLRQGTLVARTRIEEQKDSILERPDGLPSKMEEFNKLLKTQQMILESKKQSEIDMLARKKTLLSLKEIPMAPKRESHWLEGYDSAKETGVREVVHHVETFEPQAFGEIKMASRGTKESSRPSSQSKANTRLDPKTLMGKLRNRMREISNSSANRSRISHESEQNLE
jgi:hypothetical protein